MGLFVFFRNIIMLTLFFCGVYKFENVWFETFIFHGYDSIVQL
jgi:hypothetical protein